MNDSMKEHWNSVYHSREVDKLGWYEEESTPSLGLVSKSNVGKAEPILDVGSGASTFIDSLIDGGFSNIIATDISEAALDKLKERLGEERASSVRWIVDDIGQSEHIHALKDIALWHDRAVLHFLVEEEQQQAYFSTLKKVVWKGSHVIIAVFSLEGAEKCSGLDVKRYDTKMLAEKLGEDFELVDSFDYLYHMPSGDTRPYIYTLFRRK